MAVDKIAWRPVILINLLFIVNGLGYSITLAPQTQLFENIVCRHLYQDSNIASIQDKCKAPAVQEVVARLSGYQALFDGIPGLFLAMPYGVLADRFGRRFVLLLSMFGLAIASAWAVFVCWMDWPLQWVWLSSAFTIIGGGGTVASAVSMMIISDAVPDETRSRMFFALDAAFILTEIVGPVVGSALMTQDLWTPVLIGVATSLLAVCLSLLVPETLEDTKPTRTLVHSSPVAIIRDLVSHCTKTLSFILQNIDVAYIVFSFLAIEFSRQSSTILVQYVSERFGWSLAQANQLRSFRATVQLIFIAFVLPAIDAFVSSRTESRAKDLLLAKGSLVALTASFAALAFAPAVSWIFLGHVLGTMGSGANTFSRSLASALVGPHMIGTLYTALSVMETTGSLIAGPLTAEAFKLAMKLGGIWRGLPFMLSLALCGLAALFLTRIRVDRELVKEQFDDEASLLSSTDRRDSLGEE